MSKESDLPRVLAAARRIREAVRLRAVRGESVGILQAWGGCTTAQAGRAFDQNSSADGCSVEAARLRELVNSAANGRNDPDWD
jgi:hypothetical protein